MLRLPFIWQGLGDDSMDIINSVLGVHVTELSLVGCTQLKGDALMLNFHKKFPCLHTLNVRSLPVLCHPVSALLPRCISSPAASALC